ncbi:MAG: hypothetical protein LUD76_08200 [Alistipes sp.]|nr:hypothetical protein [Alistipes sp.]
MNRNFGALSHGKSSDLVKRRSQGLFYQYGRKDPFPPANDINNSTRRLFTDHHIPIEYPSGREQFRRVARPNWTNELEASIYSIQNPTTHIYTTSVPYMWNLAELYNWDFFNGYGGGTYNKTEFNPCPDGWSLPLNYPAWGDSDDFFIPEPGTAGNDFGYTRADGYYMPASGFIDNEGYYIHTGYYAGNWNAAARVEDYPVGIRIQINYDPAILQPGEGAHYGYIEGAFSEAQNIRCTRAVRAGSR